MTTEQLQVIKKCKSIYRALDHKLRQDILRFLSGGDGANVTSIYTTLKIEQSVASQHLAILKKAKVVNTKRNGKEIIYSINQPGIDRILNISNSLIA